MKVGLNRSLLQPLLLRQYHIHMKSHCLSHKKSNHSLIITDTSVLLSTDAETDLDGQVDMLEIPGKGRCYVYLAR